MTPSRIVFAALVLCATPLHATPRSTAEGATPADLLHAHLRQVETARKQAPRTAPVVSEVRREVQKKGRSWDARVPARRPVAPAGTSAAAAIPAASIARARDASDESAKALLARDASLPTILAVVAGRNPDAKTAYESWRATLRQFEQATFLEDTLSQFRSFTREVDTKVGPQLQRPMMETTFTYPSAVALRGQLVDIAARLGQLRYDQMLRKALNDAARGYFQIRYATRVIELTQENRKLFADMETLTRTQLQVGAVSQADSLKTQSALAGLDNQVAILGLERQSEIARVNALMGLRVDATWGPLVSVDLVDRELPLSQLLARAEAKSQDLAMATLEIEQMQTMIRMAEKMVLPQRPEVDPVRANTGANAAYIDELRIRLVQARRNRDAVRTKLAQMVQEAHARSGIARRTLKTYADEIAPRARQAFATMRERYNTAKAPFIEYLDAGRTYLDAAIKIEEARRDLNRALLDLQDATGEGPGGLLPR
jgi:hypothetical protein